MRSSSPQRCSVRALRVRSLAELVELCRGWTDGAGLFVRWSPDCAGDLAEQTSTDELTGVPLPGLSANGLRVEPWWEDRALDVWLARRLYDYRHLTEQRGEATRAWILAGTEVGRGPDNEPLINRCRLVAAVDASVIDQAIERIKAIPADWGSLRRA